MTMEAYQRLEVEWSKFNDLDPAGMVACSSGTAALHLALEAMEITPESEVIVPDFTMIACPRAVVMAGLRPVFVDCRHQDLLMDLDLVPGAGYFDAAVYVHVYGRKLEIRNTSKVRFVVEDLAEAHGIRPTESTDAACWSFYRNKIVAGEEGGAVWFWDPDHAKLARSLRSLGFTEAHDFNHIPRGHNYRLANCLAEKVLEGLDYAFGGGGPRHQGVTWRREVEAQYDAICPIEWRMPPRQAPWVYDFRIPGLPFRKIDDVIRVLQSAGIAARHGFKAMHRQKEFLLMGCKSYGPEREWGSLRAQQEILYLPLTEFRPEAFDLAIGVVRRISR